MAHRGDKFPRNVDLDQIFFFLEQLKEQRDYGARFWKGKDSPGDDIETVFGRTPDTDTIIGNVDVLDEMERLVTWLRYMPTVQETKSGDPQKL